MVQVDLTHALEAGKFSALGGLLDLFLYGTPDHVVIAELTESGVRQAIQLRHQADRWFVRHNNTNDVRVEAVACHKDLCDTRTRY
ncbi:hypothetical protein GQ600_8385 [Phytophthora cactorum]|nr:hypothetical protein GQ600_8385 [Phytophthora cactorum]